MLSQHSLETMFSKTARSKLRGTRVASKQELMDRIYLYFTQVNADPLISRWKYKMDGGQHWLTFNGTIIYVLLLAGFPPSVGNHRLDVLHRLIQIRDFIHIGDGDTHRMEKALQAVLASGREHAEYASRPPPCIREGVLYVGRNTNKRARSARNPFTHVPNPEVELSLDDVKHFGLRMMMSLDI